MGGADLSKLSREAGLEESDPHPKLTNLPRKRVGRAGFLRKTTQKGRVRTGQSRSGNPDRERECRGPRATGRGSGSRAGGGGRRRGSQRAAVEPRSARQAGWTERGGLKTARAAQTGKWPRPPRSASSPLGKNGLKGTPGTSDRRHNPTADPYLLPSPPALNAHPFPIPTPHRLWILSNSPTLSIPPPLSA